MLDAEGRTLRRSFVATDPAYFEGEYRGADAVHVADVPYQPIACDDPGYRSDARGSVSPFILIGATGIGLLAALVIWFRATTRQA